MPRDPFKPLTPQEQSFAFHWVREGCHEERMAVVERKARVPKGKGKSILGRPHVQRDIEARKQLVDIEQARLIARDQNRAAEKEDKRREVTLDKLEGVMDDLLNLDRKKHGSLVLATVQTALVYTGVLRAKNMERTIPVKDPSGDPEGAAAASMYTTVFSRLRQEQGLTAAADPSQSPAPLNPEDAAPAAPIPPPPPAAEKAAQPSTPPPAKPAEPPRAPRRVAVELG